MSQSAATGSGALQAFPSASQAPAIEDGEELERPTECAEHGPSPPFGLVASLFEKLESHRQKKEQRQKESMKYKHELLRSFFENYRKLVGFDLHPVVRLLVPDRDRLRNTYGVKEKLLAEAYIGAFGLSKNTSAAERLINWKAPRSSKGEEFRNGAGDFSIACYNEIKKRSTITAERGKLSIAQVNEALDRLATAKDKQERILIIRHLYDNQTATEQKWVIRIILKDLKVSIRERTVLSVLHPDAIDLFNVCSDLRRVCWTLWNTGYRLPHEDSTVKIFLPFRPMLCKRQFNDFSGIIKSMAYLGNDVKSDGFIMEEKLDGERIQLHKRGDEFRFYSRKDKDYTYLYGKNRDEGSLTPYIHHLIHSNLDEIILDGEMLSWDPVTRKTRPFGTLKTAALDLSQNPFNPRPVYKVFDVLYAKGKNQANGQNLLSKKLSAREEFIRRFVKESEGRMEWADMRTGKTEADIKGGEGLVVKNPKSTYVLNGREDSWIKVKPDYMTSMGENYDLLIIGGFWGSGKRGGYFGSFFCGILDDSNPTNPRYLSFCKVGSGLSLAYLEAIRRKTDGKWKPFPKDRRNPPQLSFGADKPDEWIAPEDSVIISVKAAEIVQDAKNYAAGLCLRFPRVAYYDFEQTAGYDSCLRLSEFVAKRSEEINKKRQIGEDNVFGNTKKKKKISTRAAPTQLAETFRGAKVDDVEVKSDIFDGAKFWVLEGDPSLNVTKNQLEKLVYENGGDYCQRVPDVEDRLIIAPRIEFISARSLIRKGESIVKPSWVLNCIETGARLWLRKEDYVHASEEVLQKLEAGEGRKTAPLPSTTKKAGPLQSSRKAVPSSETEDSDKEPTTGPIKAAVASDSETEDSGDERNGDPQTDDEEPEPNVSGLAEFAQSRPAALDAEADDMQYSEDGIFRHLYFFLDTKENAEAAALEPRNQAQPETSDAWTSIRQEILSAGGKIAKTLKDPNLTHVVVLAGDTTRAQALFKQTPHEPRYRHFVTNFWVGDSIEAVALQNEEEYRPDMYTTTEFWMLDWSHHQHDPIMDDDDGIAGVYTAPPAGYHIPRWPALYLPWRQPEYLFYPTSVWRFTVYWTLVLSAITFGLPGLWAFVVFSRKGTRYATVAIWVPLLFVLGGCLAGFMYATVVGFTLAAVYNAAYLRMSTWVPFLWACSHTLIVIVASYGNTAGFL